MNEVREPNKKELLYDIRQLLHKLVYGSKSEGIKPINKRSNICEDVNLRLKVELLEAKVKVLEESIQYLQITRPSILPNVPTTDPTIPPYNPYNPTIYCGTTDAKAMFKQYEAHQKAIDNILEGSSIDDPKIK